MQFAGISYVAVIAAAAAGFAFGAGYYTALGKRWVAALGKPEEALKQGGMAKRLVVSAIGQLVMAFMLAGVVGHLGPGQVTVANGPIAGLSLWIGFVITTIAVNYAWQGAKPMLTIIDGGHWLGVLLLQGLVIGAIGV